jgi:hypothetical protein
MSNNREGYRFSEETKEKRFAFQKGLCAESGKKGRLQAHHKIPIIVARQYCKDTEDVRDYISGEGNLIYLSPEEHRKADEFAFSNIDLLIEVITYVLGANSLLERRK